MFIENRSSKRKNWEIIRKDTVSEEEWQWLRGRIKRVIKECPVCHGYFSVARHKVDHHLTCGQELCVKAWRSRRVMPRKYNVKLPREEYQCRTCGDVVYKSHCKVAKLKDPSMVFCGIVCRGIFQTRRVILICCVCGREFFRQIRYLKVTRGEVYCSRSCSATTRQERVEVYCETCSEKILRERHRVKKGRKYYCDRWCFYAFLQLNPPQPQTYDYAFFCMLADERKERCPYLGCSSLRAKTNTKNNPFRLCGKHSRKVFDVLRYYSKRREELLRTHGIIAETPIMPDDPRYSELGKIQSELERMAGLERSV